MIVNYKIITLNDLVENQGEETVKKLLKHLNVSIIKMLINS